jgi:hypothetical protein
VQDKPDHIMEEDHTVDIMVGTVGMVDITVGMVDITVGTVGMVDITVGMVDIMVGGTTVDGGILGL